MGATMYYSCLFIIICYSPIGHGKSPREVIGGSVARIEDFPYLVSLQVSGYHICGGCFIDTKHILTATHCIVNKRNAFLDGIQVYSGTNDLDEMELNYPTEHVVLMITHLEYDLRISDQNDIALMTLLEPIHPSPVRKPFPYAIFDDDDPLPGSIVTFSGWGLPTPRSISPSQFLKKIELVVITSEECKDIMDPRITPQELCTRTADRTHLSRGDSGGGLVYKGKIVGILSTLSLIDPVQIFMRVHCYSSWIQMTIDRY